MLMTCRPFPTKTGGMVNMVVDLACSLPTTPSSTTDVAVLAVVIWYLFCWHKEKSENQVQNRDKTRSLSYHLIPSFSLDQLHMHPGTGSVAATHVPGGVSKQFRCSGAQELAWDSAGLAVKKIWQRALDLHLVVTGLENCCRVQALKIFIRVDDRRINLSTLADILELNVAFHTVLLNPLCFEFAVCHFRAYRGKCYLLAAALSFFSFRPLWMS